MLSQSWSWCCRAGFHLLSAKRLDWSTLCQCSRSSPPHINPNANVAFPFLFLMPHCAWATQKPLCLGWLCVQSSVQSNQITNTTEKGTQVVVCWSPFGALPWCLTKALYYHEHYIPCWGRVLRRQSRPSVNTQCFLIGPTALRNQMERKPAHAEP